MNHSSRTRVGVVGAGISGLACASRLQAAGCEVVVYEKSRGVGGRMATRTSTDDISFDHGAQYFTVRSERFQQLIDDCLARQVVARWHGRIVEIEDGCVRNEKTGTERYVAVPGMSSLCRSLAEGLAIQFRTRIASLDWQSADWIPRNDTGAPLGRHDLMIVTAPPFQTAELIASSPEMSQQVRDVPMRPCWATMIVLRENSGIDYDAAFVNSSSLSWIARNSSKPGRSMAPETWVLHATAEWSSEFLESPEGEIADRMVAEFVRQTGMARGQVSMATAHRWRAALPPEPLLSPYLFDERSGLGVCGDWCGGPRVEGAYLSGDILAAHILDAVVTK